MDPMWYSHVTASLKDQGCRGLVKRPEAACMREARALILVPGPRAASNKQVANVLCCTYEPRSGQLQLKLSQLVKGINLTL